MTQQCPDERVRTVPASEYNALIDLLMLFVDDSYRDRDNMVDWVTDYDPAAGTWLARILDGEDAQSLFGGRRSDGS